MSGFKIHNFNISTSGEIKKQIISDSNVNNWMESFFKRLIEIIESNQGEVGINKIGNAIRYDEKMQELFTNKINGVEVTKFFDNRNKAGGVVFNAMKQSMSNNGKCSNILILESEFRKISKLVDSTHATFIDVKKKILEIAEYFNPKSTCQINVIEIIDIPGRVFLPNLNGEYSLMRKLN